MYITPTIIAVLGPVYSWLLNNWIKSICGGWWSRCCCCWCCCLVITLFRIRIELWWWMQFYGLYKAIQKNSRTTQCIHTLIQNTKCVVLCVCSFLCVFFVCFLFTYFICCANFFLLLISLLVYDLPIASKHALLYKQTIHLIDRPACQPTSKQQRRRRSTSKKMDQQLIITFQIVQYSPFVWLNSFAEESSDFVYISDACVSVCMLFFLGFNWDCIVFSYLFS